MTVIWGDFLNSFNAMFGRQVLFNSDRGGHLSFLTVHFFFSFSHHFSVFFRFQARELTAVSSLPALIPSLVLPFCQLLSVHGSNNWGGQQALSGWPKPTVMVLTASFYTLGGFVSTMNKQNKSFSLWKQNVFSWVFQTVFSECCF